MTEATIESSPSDWAAPLRFAAASYLTSTDWPRAWPGSCEVITVWDPRFDAEVFERDEDKNTAYQLHMARAMLQRLPWLPALLDMAGAALYVGPGMCSYQLRTSAQLYPIPEMLAYTELVPWVTDEDRMQPN